MCGMAETTVSPSSSRTSRSTPWVDGCCGPIFSVSVSVAGAGASVMVEVAVINLAHVAPWRQFGRLSGASKSRDRCKPDRPAQAGCLQNVFHVVEQDHRLAPDRGVILAQRMPAPVIRHHDPAEVGVPIERDAE